MRTSNFPRSRFFAAAALVGVVLMATHADAVLIGWEAEDGSSATGTVVASLGADFDPPLSDASALGGQYITTETNFDDVSGSPTSNPGVAERVASYDVSFVETGTYDLYARVYIGADAPNDDSFFIGNGFGSKDVANGDDWITANGLPDAEVPTETYTWINLSVPNGTNWEFGEDGVTFDVAAPGAQTVQLGAREDGLRFDAFAFGTTGETFTDAQLNAAVVPEPASLGLLGMGALVLAGARRRV